jgi:hypothetical protein
MVAAEHGSAAICHGATVLRRAVLPLSKSVNVLHSLHLESFLPEWFSSWYVDAHLSALLLLQGLSWFGIPALIGGVSRTKQLCKKIVVGTSKEKLD